MKTVCLCNSTLAWGGGEKWHLEAALGLASRGWKVLLLCHPHGALYKKARQHEALTLIPYSIGRFSFLFPWKKSALTALLKEHQVHAVIMNLPADLKCIAPAAHAAGIAHIVYRRGSAIAVKNSWLNRRLYGLLTALIVNSQETRRLVLVNNPQLIAEKRIHLLPNAVDQQAFLTQLEGVTRSMQHAFYTKCGLLERIGTGERPFILGNAGRLNRQKGQHYLLYLARLLEQRNVPFHVVIAGRGEREAELVALAETLDITHRVTFLGFCNDLSVFWQCIDAFVLSSLWEGFGYVLLEAMLAEKPIVAFGVSNIPELVRHGGNGFLVDLPPASAVLEANPSLARMADYVCELACTPEKSKAMGRAGKTFAQQHFTLSSALDRLEALLSP